MRVFQPVPLLFAQREFLDLMLLLRHINVQEKGRDTSSTIISYGPSR